MSQELMLGLASSELLLAEVFIAAAQTAEANQDGNQRARALTQALSCYHQAVENAGKISERERDFLSPNLVQVRDRLRFAFQAAA